MIRSDHQNSSLTLEAIVVVGQSQKSEVIYELIGLVTELQFQLPRNPRQLLCVSALPASYHPRRHPLSEGREAQGKPLPSPHVP